MSTLLFSNFGTNYYAELIVTFVFRFIKMSRSKGQFCRKVAPMINFSIIRFVLILYNFFLMFNDDRYFLRLLYPTREVAG